jgi:hypothetical protein
VPPCDRPARCERFQVGARDGCSLALHAHLVDPALVDLDRQQAVLDRLFGDPGAGEPIARFTRRFGDAGRKVLQLGGAERATLIRQNSRSIVRGGQGGRANQPYRTNQDRPLERRSRVARLDRNRPCDVGSRGALGITQLFLDHGRVARSCGVCVANAAAGAAASIAGQYNIVGSRFFTIHPSVM